MGKCSEVSHPTSSLQAVVAERCRAAQYVYRPSDLICFLFNTTHLPQVWKLTSLSTCHCGRWIPNSTSHSVDYFGWWVMHILQPLAYFTSISQVDDANIQPLTRLFCTLTFKFSKDFGGDSFELCFVEPLGHNRADFTVCKVQILLG